MAPTTKYLAPLLVFIAIAVLLGIGLTLNPAHIPSTLINKPAPPFNLAQLHAQDQRFSPADLLGRRWLLNVWASWCVGCRVEHPLLNQLAQNTAITLVGLNYKDDPIKAKQWLAQRGDPYTIIATDLAGDAGIDYGVYGVPETFVIDERGVVIYKHTGPLTVNAIEKELLPLFNLTNSNGNTAGN